MTKLRKSWTLFLLLATSNCVVTFAQRLDSVHLALNQVFGKAVFSSCQLSITIFEGAGRSAMRCTPVPSSVPSIDVLHDRVLTAVETNHLLRLSRASNLFVGDHVGSDTTATDGIFETLKVTQSARTAVLVTSGNASFMTGDRRELLVLLHSILDDLLKSAK